ncbi:putative glycosyl transferase [Pseudobythopirellula maris]|uniref:Putative glycosyl transferase n=1 Tax=Pseudobythopirellula maris TaxID=2527991 RepID=A0A5C5ZJU7_9BACT|nr:glycosyltransferase family 4 protein [Pseudobythopirellula maris]TWT87101.1 putative glycosyl transferase [Pseudobythopirellula maris]
MRILAIYRHYWPDTTPYARILRLILERQRERGAEVCAYSGQPSYNGNQVGRQQWVETVGGVEIRRLAMFPEKKHWRVVRAINSLYFLLRAVAHATLRRRYDLVIANSHPPVAIGVALRLIRWLTGAQTILHVQDIHPEGLLEIGDLDNGAIYRMALAIERANRRGANALVTLSSDMADSLLAQGAGPDQIAIINNCPIASSPESGDARLPDCLTDRSATRFLFAGNLGRFQHLDPLIDAAHRLGERDDWRLIFMGSGAARLELEERAAGLIGERVFFLDQQSPEVAAAAMASCDYSVVSLAPGVRRYAFPSKTMTCLRAGSPLAVVVEPDSDLARIVAEHQLGLVSLGHQAEDIVEMLSEAIDRRHEFTANERLRIARTAEQLYGTERMLKEWDSLVDKIASRALDSSARAHTPPEHRAAA